MPGTVRACIVAALDKLNEDQLVRFKYELSNRKSRPIGYGLIEKERTVQIAQRIIGMFTADGAIACVADALRAIDLEDHAKSFEDDVVKPPVENEHFVDKNQVELIKRITLVKPILDHLLQKKLMSYEMYSLVDAEKTHEDQMRKLLHMVITPLGLEGKDELVRILDKEQPYIMEMLRKK